MLAEIKEKYPGLFAILSKLFSRENMVALVIALILILIYITTAADAPIWLYQGF